jgi:Tfp pilus assembly protein PilN
MNDIDLLPQWYKKNRQRQMGYRAEYFALGCVLMVMLVWGFHAKSIVSKAEAGLNRLHSHHRELKNDIRSFSEMKETTALLKKRVDILKETDSRIDVAGVLAELSFLIDEDIVLKKVRFDAVQFKSQPTGKTASAGLRTVRSRSGSNEVILTGDVRFTVLLSGIAADGSDVAELICKLEDSPYFCQVIPFFSKNQKTRAGSTNNKERLASTEFELGCYLANYKEE